MRKQVPEGTNVSAARAKAVVASCGTRLDAESRDAVSRMFKREFDGRDPEMAERFELRRSAVEDWWLTQLSDEIQPKFYKS
jgi:hypothetical protein